MNGTEVGAQARIEHQAIVLRGRVDGTVGALSLVGTQQRPFTVDVGASVRTTFMPMGYFGGTAVAGNAVVVGDAEYNVNVSAGFHYGLVDGTARATVNEVTVPPPYAWRP